MRVENGQEIFEIGDTLIGVNNGSGVRIGEQCTVYKESWKMCGEWFVGIICKDGHEHGPYQRRVVFDGGCGTCKYECKMMKSCALKEEKE